jgi:adenylate cyclase
LAGTEGYLPWLEALGHLLRGGEASIKSLGASAILRQMRELAPTWYAQLAPFSISETSALQLAAERAASQERMKRELVEFVEEVSRAEPLVLFFEDLHWADASTIDLLTFLASRFAGLRVLILATYRPSDLLLAKHPFLRLKPELQSRGLCREIALGLLPRAEVDKYLALEFPGHRLPAELSTLIYAKTEGNPLFMADLARYLRDRNVIAQEQGSWTLVGSLPDIERDLPESVRGMVECKIAQLSEDDRRLLVAGSVQGYEFDSAVITKALAADAAQVEEQLDALERIHGLVVMISEQEFPDLTLTVRYRFVHVLYQNALYAQLRPTRRAALSATVAEALRGFYGGKRRTVASTLAVLYEAARDWRQAADHFLIAARNALRGFANQEAIALTRRGLAMLEKIPLTPDRALLEIRLQTTLGLSLMMVRGYAATEVLQTHSRARELCLQHGDDIQLFQAEFGLAVVHVVRAEYEQARELAEHCLQLAQGAPDPMLFVQAHWLLGLSKQFLGELVPAREHFEQTIALYDQKLHVAQNLIYGAILSRAHLGRLLVYLGYADRSKELIREAMSIAEQTGNTLGLCNTLSITSFVEVLYHRSQQVREKAETILAISDEHGLPHYRGTGQCLRGWALAMEGETEEGVALLRAGMAALRAGETEQQRAHYLVMLAEALGAAGRLDEALAALGEAVETIDRTAEHFYEVELYRLKGELWLARRGDESEAEQCFQQAINIARQQYAKTFELRAVTSLARLWQQQGRQTEAHTALTEIYDSFSEGFDTPDLRGARALLEELSKQPT